MWTLIIHHQMQVEPGGKTVLDLIEKLQKLLMPVFVLSSETRWLTGGSLTSKEDLPQDDVAGSPRASLAPRTLGLSRVEWKPDVISIL
jgi:hypothetical protein